ncbi:MAG: hypothetical protein IPL59_24270 [Candidatus Competibacteraceae bacterium]|nr:hypothetical protein [Candidatus Competibacteraceae bacterium]
MPTKHKSSDIAVKFPVTDADWDALIAVAPDSVDDPDMRPIDWSNQDFRFPSFPRQRESSKPLKKAYPLSRV